jgi:hypothetical protein
LFEKGRINKIAIDITRATTPPSLLGIDRKIAYANRKYHSGWMCTGVTSGLAGVKLSGSPSTYGFINGIIVSIIIMIMNPRMSLNVKYGWNGILSIFLFTPKGLFDPVWCKNNKWIITIAIIMNGKMK